MLASNIVTSIVLPSWVYEGTKTEKEIASNAHIYIISVPNRYQGYRILKIENGIAICERAQVN
ncbi:hypothetical protein [Bacillus mycoides]|uniref:hypothetical protein n=2 Tax=Bacillus mycoides TaxID=1405 RepID=UPI003D20F3A3